MASAFFKPPSRYAWGLSLALAAALSGCGREDIELSPGAGSPAEGPPPPEPDDCSAAVPSELLLPRPPLGWNPYNAFECAPALNEDKVKANVDALVSSGMQSAGYQYVNLDKCWEGPRSANGERVLDPVRLPGGAARLADYIHQRGFSFGLFAPTQDCFEAPGGEGHEATDAATYAAWGVDYLKYVSCTPGPGDHGPVYRAMASALADVTRPIVLSIAAPPFAEWMPSTGQLWRTSGNAAPEWGWLVRSIDETTPLAAYVRPGAFNDPDTLEVGNGTLAEGEQRVQFSVWSILAAPLLAGNDLSQMSEATRSILTNSELIALDQDALALQGSLVHREGDIDVLAKPLTGCGARGVVLWNRGTANAEVTLSWSQIWLSPGLASVRDLWAGLELTPSAEGITIAVPGHDAVALRVVGNEPALPTGRSYLSDLEVTYAVNGLGPVERDTSVGEAPAGDGRSLRLRGRAYAKGLGVHGPSLLRYRLGRACSRFVADVGIDDETTGRGSAQFEVWADGVKLFESGVMTGTSPPKRVDVDVTDRRDLRLFVGIGGNDFMFDHADWADAQLVCAAPPTTP